MDQKTGDGGVESSIRRTRRIRIIAWIGFLGALAVIIGMQAGKAYMEQKEREAAYQVAMQEIQKTVTDYLVNNYEGITRVEWQGIGVEFLASDVLAHSMYPNYVSSEARVYVNDTDYFTVGHRLKDLAEYDDTQNRFVLNEMLTPSKMDDAFRLDLADRVSQTNNLETRAFEKFMKSPAGSLDAEIVYNVDIFKFDW